MKKNIIKVALIAAFAIVAGYNVYNSQKTDVMSDLALANVEALAQTEGLDRPDCVSANDICSELIIYPGGDYGENINFNLKKRPGWL